MLREYLAEQSRLSAVDRFAAAHSTDRTASGRYRELLPESAPGAGEQYAFEVDLDRCTGCKACVTGCHNRNGLDAEETWRMTGAVRVTEEHSAFTQTVTTACHHCAEPACLSGCPVVAYEKDADTGIVVHLDDQCIGCRYCTMQCPYDVPQYDAARGIVRKCDLCTDRLAEGEAPACAEACPTEAIRIVTVPRDRTMAEAASGFAAIAGAPDAAHTLPSTTYRTSRESAVGSIPVPSPVVQEPHLPLVTMLLLTQSSVGVLGGSLLLVALGLATPGVVFAGAIVATFLACAGIAASIFHLGRPLYAFRAVLGLRTSWLSREIVGFGAYLLALLFHLALSWDALAAGATASVIVSACVGFAIGTVAVACSAMVYIATPRRAWATSATALRFARTSVVAGCAWSALVASAAAAPIASVLGTLLVIAVLGAATVEIEVFGRAHSDPESRWHCPARLLDRELRSQAYARLRFAAVGAAGFALCAVAMSLHAPTALLFAVVGTVGVAAGEAVERILFFAAVDVPTMPGLRPSGAHVPTAHQEAPLPAHTGHALEVTA